MYDHFQKSDIDIFNVFITTVQSLVKTSLDV
jgi:hypothetical protein